MESTPRSFDPAMINADIVSGRPRFPSDFTVHRPWNNRCFTMTDIGIFSGPIQVEAHGSSAWASSFRISIQGGNGDTADYFMKVSSSDATTLCRVWPLAVLML